MHPVLKMLKVWILVTLGYIVDAEIEAWTGKKYTSIFSTLKKQFKLAFFGKMIYIW